MKCNKTRHEIGDWCYLTNGTVGICQDVRTCESAKRQLTQQSKPNTCGYDGVYPIVCCELVNITRSANQDDTVTRKADEKCAEWLRGINIDLVYAFGGVDAQAKEFLHMAILGYGDGKDFAFQCGGSLISEQFVLTAAHCLVSRQLGNVTSVRLGDLDIASTTDPASPQDLKVVEVYEHPDYSPDSHYHDIALLKLEKPALFSKYVRPACLQTTLALESDKLTASGWGATYFGGDMHSFLQVVQLSTLPVETCGPTYKAQAKLLNGIDDSIQICAGNLQKSMDTCQGDSGGPLQIKIKTYPSIHRVVGITSFGKDCGLVPAIYTRVSTYIDWIESIVWP